MTGPVVPVLAAQDFDPGVGRVAREVPAGLTIAQIVAVTLPALPEEEMGQLRAVLVTPRGAEVIARHHWAVVRPKSGVRVVLRLVPGKQVLRAVLLSVVSIAAVALGSFLAPFIIPAAGLGQTLVAGLISAGLSVVGQLLVNALIPLPSQDAGDTETRNTYSISGWQNRAHAGQPVPLPLGIHRYAPPFAARSYTEIVGDQQFIRALFCFGYGPVQLSDMRLGNTPLEDFDEVEVETREGLPGDDPVTLYPTQVVEETVSAELVRPLPRDDAGEVVEGDSIETPIRRYTATNATKAAVVLSFPSGLVWIGATGRLYNRTVQFRIRQRAEGSESWDEVVTLKVKAKKREAFFRQHVWELPSRGRWQIEITRLTDEANDTQIIDRSVLAAVQSHRPEYPINMTKPLALAALRIKATHQLNGALQNFNALVKRVGKTFDAATGDWGEGVSQNPASAYLTILQSPASPFPQTDAQIDLEAIADWYQFCAAKGLRYNHVHDRDESLQDALLAICSAGRATPRHDGRKWSVVVDRPDSLVVDHINHRNSGDFAWSRGYFTPPDGFRVAFLDETNDYAPAERVVPWPGFEGTPELTEAIALPGKTHPDEIWIESRRRMYELTHRPDTLTTVQSGLARTATRGDLVMGSFDVLDGEQVAARVTAVDGMSVVLDEAVTFAPGTEYAMRFMTYDEDGDESGQSTSHLSRIAGGDGATRAVRITEGADVPPADTIVHIGPRATESLPLKLRSVEAGENFAQVLELVPAAPEIDALTDAETPPPWNGQVGTEADSSALVPQPPRFTQIAHGAAGTGTAGLIEVTLVPGAGAGAVVASYRLDHKPAAGSTWLTTTSPGADGGAELTVYDTGDEVSLRAFALDAGGRISAPSATVTFVVGSDDALIPAMLDGAAIQLKGGLGSAELCIGTTEDAATTQVQVYRVPAGGTLNRQTHAVGLPIAATPLSTLRFTDGDGTRVNLLKNPDFADSTEWTGGANWAVSGGDAVHVGGAADALSQTVSLSAGTYYRTHFTLSARTAGGVTLQLQGGSTVSSTQRSTNGTHRARLQAVAGNTALVFEASSDFEGILDDVALFAETEACIAQGGYDYYLEPQNENSVSGPVSGPFNTFIT